MDTHLKQPWLCQAQWTRGERHAFCCKRMLREVEFGSACMELAGGSVRESSALMPPVCPSHAYLACKPASLQALVEGPCASMKQLSSMN
eukprot:scaffold71509_cov23-Tisochrysis_lutea.AAC.1